MTGAAGWLGLAAASRARASAARRATTARFSSRSSCQCSCSSACAPATRGADGRASRSAERVVAFYNKRGTCEQWIKEGKGAIKWTRLSCRTFAANAVRLQLHALAGNFLRTLATPGHTANHLAFALPEGFEAQVRPRSGLAAKNGVTVANNLVLNLYQHVNSPEGRLYLSRQLFEEAVHVQFYLTLLDTYDVRFPGWGGQPVAAWLHVPAGSTQPLPTVVSSPYSSVRVAVSMVVGLSSCQSISPRPLFRWTSTFRLDVAFN